MAISCPHCGARLADTGDGFCSECYNALDEIPSNASQALQPTGHPVHLPGQRLRLRSKHLRIVALVGAGVLLLGVCCLFFYRPPNQPIDELKGLGFWIKRVQDKSATTRKEALLALSRFGPQAKGAIPAIIQAIRQTPKDELEGPAYEETALRSLRLIDPEGKETVSALLEALKDRNEGNVASLVKALKEYGPKGAPAIPALLEMLNSPEISIHASRALAATGKAALPFLLEAAKNSDVRGPAIYLLGRLASRQRPRFRFLRNRLPTQMNISANARQWLWVKLRLIGLCQVWSEI
jgi:hypothetical protein